MTLDLGRVRVLLCDADDNLFPSEKPAFAASTDVTNALLRDLGSDSRFEPDELRRVAAGRNFRATALALAAGLGRDLTDEELEARVAEEKRRVTAHLADVLRPDPAVRRPLEGLAARYALAAVSSSAHARLEACFTATGLADLFPVDVRFSAEDSLPVPTSKPDPAIYLHAGVRLGVSGAEALAIEDSVPGVQSAVAAGFPTVGNVVFVSPEERESRVAALFAAGAAAVVSSWTELAQLLGPRARIRPTSVTAP